MISLKKLLFKTIEGTRLRVQTVTASSISVNANSDKSVTTQMGITSGTPIGIVGFAVSGTSTCFVSELHLNGTAGSLTVKLHNTSSSAATATVIAYVLVRG